jgi:hypothetical protein
MNYTFHDILSKPDWPVLTWWPVHVHLQVSHEIDPRPGEQGMALSARRMSVTVLHKRVLTHSMVARKLMNCTKRRRRCEGFSQYNRSGHKLWATWAHMTRPPWKDRKKKKRIRTATRDWTGDQQKHKGCPLRPPQLWPDQYVLNVVIGRFRISLGGPNLLDYPWQWLHSGPGLFKYLPVLCLFVRPWISGSNMTLSSHPVSTALR